MVRWCFEGVLAFSGLKSFDACLGLGLGEFDELDTDLIDFDDRFWSLRG